jgi:hypothetical protein
VTRVTDSNRDGSGANSEAEWDTLVIWMKWAEGEQGERHEGSVCRATFRRFWCKYLRVSQQGQGRSIDYCGEYRIPDCRGILVFEMETSQGELSFANTTEQFDAGDGDSCAIKVLKAEHRTCSGFNAPVILLDQIVQVFRRSQLGVLPCLVFPWHLAHCSVRCGVAIQCDTDRYAFLGTKRFAEKSLGCRDVSGRT